MKIVYAGIKLQLEKKEIARKFFGVFRCRHRGVRRPSCSLNSSTQLHLVIVVPLNLASPTVAEGREHVIDRQVNIAETFEQGP